ncbi:hypothetical protein PsAD37_05104 [Pseudovibrio sp. Ad37]|nr:hypothetical protein PsAD37_05104 [Pseudovibrio sp. Ad37]
MVLFKNTVAYFILHIISGLIIYGLLSVVFKITAL